MTPAVAAVVCTIGILGLFWLDREPKGRTSAALWIPLIWLSFACTRSISEWMQVGGPDWRADQVAEGSPLDRLLFTFLIVLGLGIIIKRWQQAGRLLRANGAILVFLFYCALSVLWSDYPDVAFKRWTRAVGDLVMVLIVWTEPEPIAAFTRIVADLGYVLIPLSVLFIKYYPAIGVAYTPWGGPGDHRGATSNKNKLGAICLCLGLAALWRLIRAYQEPKTAGRTRRKIAQVVVLLMVLWLFHTANSIAIHSKYKTTRCPTNQED